MKKLNKKKNDRSNLVKLIRNVYFVVA